MNVVRILIIWGLLFGVTLSSSVAPCRADSLLTKGAVYPVLTPRVSSSYGKRRHPISHVVKHHSGVDLAVPTGSHVRVVKQGRVVFADRYAGYGKLVTVMHENGYVSLYGHLHEILVNPGDTIAAGQIIGRVGKTGAATGAHLHFEWRKDGKPLNPAAILPQLGTKAKG